MSASLVGSEMCIRDRSTCCSRQVGERDSSSERREPAEAALPTAGEREREGEKAAASCDMAGPR
eukprot:8959421-Alexandrium_andersonii.AAC.1